MNTLDDIRRHGSGRPSRASRFAGYPLGQAMHLAAYLANSTRRFGVPTDAREAARRVPLEAREAARAHWREVRHGRA